MPAGIFTPIPPPELSLFDTFSEFRLHRLSLFVSFKRFFGVPFWQRFRFRVLADLACTSGFGHEGQCCSAEILGPFFWVGGSLYNI
jgi:hypothetical protein